MNIDALGPYGPYLVLGLIGLIAGWLSGLLLGGGGLLRNLVVGLLGALVGGYLVRAGLLPLPFDVPFPYGKEIIVATIGAIIVTVVVRLLARA